MMFLVFLYIVIKVGIDKKPFTHITAKQKKRRAKSIFLCSLPSSFVSLLVFFCVSSSMSSLSLTSSTTKHTYDTHHKLKQRLKQGPCVFLLFCFHCCYLRFQGLFVFFLIILHGLSALLNVHVSLSM